MSSFTRRPRDVGTIQSAAILYGDWGTSKAYVIGLAFAIAGYSSFWLIAAVCLLTALVGLNYIAICKYNPTGGGAYASVRRKSEIIALIAAFFLIADYLITAAISALSSFSYLGVTHPEFWAIGSIIILGIINLFGPKHSGNLAFAVAIPTFIVVVLISVASLPFTGEAWHAIKPLEDNWFKNWINFVSIIVALSGIESIANNTGVMKLDPGATEENPSVDKTSKKAIWVIMIEVCLFTTLLGFAANALPGLQQIDGEVIASNGDSIRDSMLKYMGQYFVSYEWGDFWGQSFGFIISLVFGIFLLSAVNTAIISLVSLLFVMSRDGELPGYFQKINRFGVPYYPLLIAVACPVMTLVFVHDIAALADLYAVGFVGAIATNLGSTSMDKDIPLKKWERIFMFSIFIIMALIEVSLFIYKPNARRFVLSVVAIGLVLRALVIEQRQRAWIHRKVHVRHASVYEEDKRETLHQGAILCATNRPGKTLDFAMEEAKGVHQTLYILFVREQKVITEEDHMRSWLDDPKACEVFDYAKDSASLLTMKFIYAVSDDPAQTIVEMASQYQVSRVVLGKSRRNAFLNMLRGNLILEVSDILPQNIDLLVIS